MTWQGAWSCHDCPKSQDPEKGCPAWMEVIERNLQDGSVRVTKDCSFILMPQLLLEAFRTNNGIREAVIKTREDVLQGVNDAQGRLLVSLIGRWPRPPGPHLGQHHPNLIEQSAELHTHDRISDQRERDAPEGHNGSAADDPAANR